DLRRKSMRGIAFAPYFNTPPHKKGDPMLCTPEGLAKRTGEKATMSCDAFGAFHPGLDKFSRLHHIKNLVYFNNYADRSGRWQQFLEAMRTARGGLEVVAYFGDGTQSSMASAGFSLDHVSALARAIRAKAAPGIRVLLYACSSGYPGGFASHLAEA